MSDELPECCRAAVQRERTKFLGKNVDTKWEWQKAALQLGEQLSSSGPPDYYEMGPTEWLDWAKAQAKAEPVAWQVRADAPGVIGMFYGTEQQAMSARDTFLLSPQNGNVIVVPLYAHPPTNELITALQRAKEWLQGSEPHRAKYLGEVLDRVAHPPTSEWKPVEPNVICPVCQTGLGARWLTQDDVEPPVR